MADLGIGSFSIGTNDDGASGHMGVPVFEKGFEFCEGDFVLLKIDGGGGSGCDGNQQRIYSGEERKRGGGQADVETGLEGKAGAQGIDPQGNEENVDQRKDGKEVQPDLKMALQFHSRQGW